LGKYCIFNIFLIESIVISPLSINQKQVLDLKQDANTKRIRTDLESMKKSGSSQDMKRHRPAPSGNAINEMNNSVQQSSSSLYTLISNSHSNKKGINKQAKSGHRPMQP